MTRIRVGIIFGGRSSEHEISLLSAKNIINAIDKQRFDIVLLGIDKQGNWHFHDAAKQLLYKNTLANNEITNSKRSTFLLKEHYKYQLIYVDYLKVLFQLDVIFPIIHGAPGEDGSLQGLLKIVDIPYVGSDVLGSAISMDKDISKRLLRDAGLSVAPFLTLYRTQQQYNHFNEVTNTLGLPLFIKPANQGSSIGISKVTNQESFKQALKMAFHFDNKVLIEATIIGRELECAILGNDKPKASLCGEVVLSSLKRDDFYSYHNKYINTKSVQVKIPADISQVNSDKIRYTALQAFQILNCSGMARVDVFLTIGGKVIINEINTLPGFTKTSMYPKLWQASGINYTDLINQLIKLALARHQKN